MAHALPIEWSRIRGDGSHVLACPRIKVAALGRLLMQKHIEALEQNQKIAHCCRHPENHEVEAWFTNPRDEANGTPDLYAFHCTCGRKHRYFCVGGGVRPVWGSR